MTTVMISGQVIGEAGQSMPNAEIHFISDLATLGANPEAVVSMRTAIRWTRKITGFAGHRWNAYTKYVAREVAGISFAEFKNRVVAENLSLLDSGYIFKPGNTYMFPQNDPIAAEIRWDRELTNFSGNRWACWENMSKAK